MCCVMLQSTVVLDIVLLRITRNVNFVRSTLTFSIKSCILVSKCCVCILSPTMTCTNILFVLELRSESAKFRICTRKVHQTTLLQCSCTPWRQCGKLPAQVTKAIFICSQAELKYIYCM